MGNRYLEQNYAPVREEVGEGAVECVLDAGLAAARRYRSATWKGAMIAWPRWPAFRSTSSRANS